MRRKLKRMAVCVAIVCGLVGLWAYVARDPVRDVLGRAASAWLSRRLNGTLEIGALRGSLWSSLVLRDVVLRDRAGLEVAHLDEVRLGYDLTTLFTKRLVVQHVHFVHPQATLVQDPEGQWNLSRILSPAAPPGPPPAPERAAGGGLPIALVVEHVQIQDGQITLHTAALPSIQQLTDVQAHLQGQVDGREFHFQVHQLSVRATPAEAVLTLTALGPPEALAVRGQLSAEDSRVDLHGQLNTRSTP